MTLPGAPSLARAMRFDKCLPWAGSALARAAVIALSVLCLFGGGSREAAAQLVQDGPKLVGSGIIGGNALQGTSVAVSADGNTAIVGGPQDQDNELIGAAWVYIKSNGVWTQQQKLVGSNAIVGQGQVLQGIVGGASADGNTATAGGRTTTAASERRGSLPEATATGPSSISWSAAALPGASPIKAPRSRCRPMATLRSWAGRATMNNNKLTPRRRG